jgi:hypothetical protein
VTLALVGVAGISGVTKMIAARRACVTFAGFDSHGSVRTMWKALNLIAANAGSDTKKGQTKKHENKRE